MNPRKMLVVLSLLLVSAVASANQPRAGIVAFAPLKVQVQNSAQNHGVWAGNKPMVSLKLNKKGTRGWAAVSSLSYDSVAGRVKRKVSARATFDIVKTIDGKWAKEVERAPNLVWEPIFTALSAGQAQ